MKLYMKMPKKKASYFSIVFWVLITLLLSLRIYPAFTVPPFGDEGSDFIVLYKDYVGVMNFFDADMVMASDQARLSHLLGGLVISILGVDNVDMFNDIGIIRMIFFFIHIVYLVVSYHFIKKLFNDREAAYLYTFFLTASCYLAAYSTAVMTTGESVYMLFQLLSIWAFYSSFKSALADKGNFSGFSLLSILLAACIASKLFGLFILIAFGAFHLIHLPKMRTLWIKSVDPKYMAALSMAFFFIILAINFIPMPLKIKTIAALGLGIIYLVSWIGLAVCEHKGAFSPKKINFIYFWGLLTFCCFTLVLVISPIYLNLSNLLDVFSWFDTWGAEKINIVSSKVDALVIMMLKFGAIPTVLLVIVILSKIKRMRLMSRDHRLNFLSSIQFLLILVVGLNLLLISMVQLKLPWHGLSVFPYLFVPFATLFPILKTKGRSFVKVFVIAVLIVVPMDNIYRYLHWYPYGHFDGGQYGKDHIGLNRSCLVSFELVPTFYDFFSTLNQKENYSYQSVNVQGVNVRVLNDYLIQMLTAYFHHKGQKQVQFISDKLNKDHSDLILSSPIFTPDIEARLRADSYQKIKTLTIADIAVASVWKGKFT